MKNELIKKLRERIKKFSKDRQFEADVRGTRAEIFRLLKHYDKIKATYYTEQERDFILKNLKTAEKAINEIFKTSK